MLEEIGNAQEASNARGTQAVVKCARTLMTFLSKFGRYCLEFHANIIWKSYDIELL